MDEFRERSLHLKLHVRRSTSVESTEDSPSLEEEAGPPGEKRLREDYFPASRLFEYQWPLGPEGSEFYILQEQVKEFLDIRGIQRKYPDLYRRNVELDERKYLMGRGVVTEMQSNMGLVALRSEDVLELMMEDYQDKFAEYQSVLQEREFQATLHKKMMEAKRVAVLAESQPVVQSIEVTEGAVQDAASFNSRLAEIRRNFRSNYVNHQTNLQQVPRPNPLVCPSPKLSRYPVALLPGQYSDYVRHYSPGELSRLPLKTVTDFSELEKVVQPEHYGTPAFTGVPSQLLPGGTPNRPHLPTLLPGMLNSSTTSSTPINLSLPKVNFSIPSALLSAIFSKAIQANSACLIKTTSSQEGGTKMSVPKPRSEVVKEVEKSKTGTISSKESEVAPTISESSSTTDARDTCSMDDVPVVVEASSDRTAAEKDKRGEDDEEVVVVASGTVAPMAAPEPATLILSGSKSVEVVDRVHHHVAPQNKYTLCSICFKSRSCNKVGRPEDMINCSSCSSSVHPSCYDLTASTVLVARSYCWQCLNCKKCHLCSDAGHDDQMMCCDMCDRGYHSFCVGLSQIPGGHWWCKLCTSCASCGRGSESEGGVVMDKRGEESEEWKNEYYKDVYVQTLCKDCSSYYRSGYFCPVCLKVYHNDETDSPMVCCDSCDRWIHTDCDGISPELYSELSKEEKSTYICSICKGKTPDKVDQHHKKHKTNEV